jgi:hypothetical protein
MTQVIAASAFKKIKLLQEIPRSAVAKGYEAFVAATPIKSGNARRNTKQVKTTIEADYPYAEPLDARAHMTEAAIKAIKDEIIRQLRGK